MILDSPTVLNPPFLTPDLPGIGGHIKAAPEDFAVEEIPAYEPCGTGAFLFLWIEKRSIGAEYFVRQVARRLGISPGEVGTAGLKDRHAVTRQWVSVPATAESRIKDLDGDGIGVLRTSRHGNKLRPGHLRGNRFRIVIREHSHGGDVLGAVQDVISRIAQEGLPNYYGPQRFGKDSETLQLGLDLLSRTATKVERGGVQVARPKVRNRFLHKLALSALQSALFNVYLARRMGDGLLHKVLLGDVMAKWPTGGMFVAVDTAAEQARLERREIVSAGPIFGKKTFPATADAAEREQAVLANSGLSRESFGGFGKLLQGSRRHNVVYVDDLAATSQLDTVQLTFALPAGSYASMLLREVMKVNIADEEAAVEE